jgi:fructuronate reductase
MRRLNVANARQSGVPLPPYAGQLAPGIVHLGIGAFARAHTAVFTANAISRDGDGRWGILGVSQRSGDVPAQLAPQDALFSVTTRGGGEENTEVIASLTGAMNGPAHTDDVVAAMADPQTRIVTLTVTEKGYRLRADGTLNVDDPAIRADLAGGTTTMIGQLAAAIVRRGGAPLTIVPCDNLPHNGLTLRQSLEQYASALGGADGSVIADALAHCLSTPDTMVDRMVPAPTSDDVMHASHRLGLYDGAAVVTEPFLQWVIVDDFAAGRPRWDLAGAQLVQSAAPWEDAKLRILNASHSLLAYLGMLGGTRTIAETVRVPEWAHAVRGLIYGEVAKTIVAPQGLDIAAYGEQVIHRFENPYLGHTVEKVSSDGSLKLGPRLVATLRKCSREGVESKWAALGIAAWAACVYTMPERMTDPRRRELAQLASTKTIADATLKLLRAIAPDIADEGAAAAQVLAWSRAIQRGGIAAIKEEIHAD